MYSVPSLVSDASTCSGIALAHASQHQPADFSPVSLSQVEAVLAINRQERGWHHRGRGREGLLISIGLRPQPDGEAEALRLARRPMPSLTLVLRPPVSASASECASN
jgi:hypothetical protein